MPKFADVEIHRLTFEYPEEGMKLIQGRDIIVMTEETAVALAKKILARTEEKRHFVAEYGHTRETLG